MDAATKALIDAAYRHAQAHPDLAAAVAQHKAARALLDKVLTPDGIMVIGARGARAKITPIERRILETLATHAPCLVPKNDLGRAVWPYYLRGMGTSHTVETHMYRLRRKLAEIVAPVAIVTENTRPNHPSDGYRLVMVS